METNDKQPQDSLPKKELCMPPHVTTTQPFNPLGLHRDLIHGSSEERSKAITFLISVLAVISLFVACLVEAHRIPALTLCPILTLSIVIFCSISRSDHYKPTPADHKKLDRIVLATTVGSALFAWAIILFR